MPAYTPLIVLGLVILGIIILSIQRAYVQGREARIRINQELGFSRVVPSPELSRKISQLYETTRLQNREHKDTVDFELQNVFSKRLIDGEMYIFDLIDRSGNETTRAEQQAVAVISSRLHLPPFVVFPKPGSDGAASKLASRVMSWALSKFGNPVEFSEHPEFEKRYLVNSPDADATRRFLDGRKLGRLAETRYVSIHAAGDVFALSQLNQLKTPTKPMMRERVDQTSSVFSLFTS
jgi:hypothetical protein